MTREEAIDVIKELQPNDRLREALHTIIPELRESEDEMIRKRLINLIREFANAKLPILTSGYFIDGQDKKYIGYLEKQKEQKPAASWTIQDARPGDILNSARVQATIIFKGFNPDGKHIDAYCALQKGIFITQEMPWDRDFESATQVWKDALFDAMVRKGYLWDAENKRLNKAVQQPAEWSKEDKEMLDAIIHDVMTLHNAKNLEELKNKVNWLKSLRPVKQEWSEEDEEMINALIRNQEILIDSASN